METIEAGWALITGNASQAHAWIEGKPKSERPRKSDEQGRPLTQVTALMRLPLLGVLEVTLAAPDSQAEAMAKGALVTFPGGGVSVFGGDFGSLRATVTVEHLTPAGDGVAALEQAAQSTSRKTAS